MIKAVLFDLDGVLVVTDELHYAAWKKLADRENIYFDRNINNRLRGVSREASLNIILEKASRTYGAEQKLEMSDYKNGLYVQSLSSLSEKDILPGVKELLSKLADMNIKTAVASGSKNCALILSKIGLSDAFGAVITGEDILRGKPDPEVFLKAAAKLETDACECAVVEDAAAGIEAAKKGGMTAVAVADAVKSPLADYRLNNIYELLNAVAKENGF